MKKLLLPILVLGLVLYSCTDDLTSLNENPKGTEIVPAEPLFTNAQTSLADWLTEPNVNLNIFKLVSQYWASTTYTSESQYELTTRQIPDNLYSEHYRDILKDLDEAVSVINDDELLPDAQKANQLAQIEVVSIYAWYNLVTIFGDIPYSEALDPDNTQPVFDGQQAIYTDLMSRLNSAISNFDPSSTGFTAAGDLFYGGDINKWVKFANSLKMRLAITLADVDPSTAQTAIEAASPNAFTSNADNATFSFVSAPPWTNPIWEALVQSGRHDYVPANTFVDNMNNLDDPRRPMFFTLHDSDGDGAGDVYSGGVYGVNNNYADYSHFADPIKQPTFEALLLGYEEVEFIRAEANERGWLTGTSAQAEVHYNNAITADMEWWGVDQADITAYLAQPDVAYGTASGTFRDKIGLQKYIAMYPQGLQEWTEWRRLDAPTFNGIPSVGITEDDIPTRFTYPVDEQNLNESNWQSASQSIGGDELTTKLFWDVN